MHVTLSTTGLITAGKAAVVEGRYPMEPPVIVERIYGMPKVTTLVVPLKIYVYLNVAPVTLPNVAVNVLETIVVYVVVGIVEPLPSRS